MGYTALACIAHHTIDCSLYIGRWIPIGENGRCWGAYNTTIEIDADTKIDAQFLPPFQEEEVGTILFCMPNACSYRNVAPWEFEGARKKGYSVMLYDPPSYGHSTGRRTPEADYRAIDGVINYLVEEKKIDVEKLHIIGMSLGSGPSCWAASRHKIASLTLVGALARTESVVERIMARTLSRPITRCVATLLTNPVIGRGLRYDNDLYMKRCKAKRVWIVEAGTDKMMTVGGSPEAKRLADSWPGEPSEIDVTIVNNASHNDILGIASVGDYFLYIQKGEIR